MTRLLGVLGAVAIGCATAPATGPAPRFATFTVRGRVVGADGQPVKFGHARLRPLVTKFQSRLGRAEMQLGADGRFTLESHEGGYHTLEVTAVDHARLRVLVQLLADAEVEVRLGTYPAGVGRRVIRWHSPKDRKTQKAPLVEQPGGQWVAEVDAPGGPLHYHAVGVSWRRGVNGTTAGAWTYDGDGDYESVIDLAPGRARITYDPAQVPAPGQAARVEFKKLPAAAVELAHASRQAWEARDLALGEADGVSAELHQRHWAETIARLRAAAASATTLDARNVLRLAMLWAAERGKAPGAVTAEEVDALLSELQPTEALWSAFPESIPQLSRATSKAAVAEYLRRMGESSADHRLRSEALLAQLRAATEANQSERARALYQRFRSDKELVGHLERAVVFNPDWPLRPGAALPAIDFAPLPGTEGRIDNASQQGKLTLFDFWGTWCKPCLEELPRLHAVQSRFKSASRPLAVVSVAVKSDLKELAKLRATWPMPWKHGWIDGWFEEAEADRLGLFFVPFLILVDEEGRVIRASPELRGENLEAELEKAQGPGAPPKAP